MTDINRAISSVPSQDILRLLSHLTGMKNDCSRFTKSEKDDTIDKLEHNKSTMFTCY